MAERGEEEDTQSQSQPKILRQLRDGQLSGLQVLDLPKCSLVHFPEEVLAIADSLTRLNLAQNQLRDLPESITKLHRLRVLFFLENHFELLPSCLGRLPSLYMLSFKSNRIRCIEEDALAPTIGWLILTDNQIPALPASIGKLQCLRKLMLASNLLQSLPDELSHCRELELVRLSANRLTELPPWLLRMPRLAWLALAGNPISHSPPPSSIAELPWSDVEVLEQLGEGASGVVSKGRLKSALNITDVAVKLFKSAATSDGLPEDEMAAASAVGRHPNIVPILGKIIGGSKPGLVLELLSTEWKSLGNPPSFESVTRDTFAENTVFHARAVSQILKGVASAAAFLHSMGILHGDLYAHNIMINDTGHPLLSDFGAASFYDSSGANARFLECLEVRAFGCLMEDLLDRVQDMKHRPFLALRDLQRMCMSPTPEERPSFSDICNKIRTITDRNVTKGSYDTSEWLRILAIVAPMLAIMMYLYALKS